MLKHHQKAIASIRPQTLYIVATPIGNLADITLRALAVLQTVDIICAEDTRVSMQLLNAYGIQGKLISVREHNERQMAEKIIAALTAGKSIAQISDAGTPAICDPGAKLVEQVRLAGFNIIPIMGASAVMAALSVAGISQSHFYFHGFLPSKSTERQKLFAQWHSSEYPIIVFESPHRIESTLADMATQFPNRHIMLAREISKTFETFSHGSVKEIQKQLQQDNNQTRGEMVLILYPNPILETPSLSEQAIHTMKILSSELPTKQAADLTARICGENKKSLYNLALTWKNMT